MAPPADARRRARRAPARRRSSPGSPPQAAVPVGWYRAETWDADEASFVRHLEAALRSALPGPARRLDERRGRRARPSRPRPGARGGARHRRRPRARGHGRRGARSAASSTTRRRGSRSSSRAASRPSINLPRLRVSGELLELGPDDLRFRAWEVEQLFRDVYHDPVLPGDLAVLARRTEGWAAGLQLFHLATRGRSADERRRVLSGAEIERPAPARVPRPERAVRAAARTCASSSSTPACSAGCRGRCAIACAETTGSGALLDELARRSVFTVPVEDDDDAFRYHEVLRQHLDRMLVEEVGEAEARARHARAGRCPRGRRRAPRGAAGLLPRRGLGRRPAAAGRAGRAARGDRAERAGSTRSRRPSSATTRGSRWPPPAGRATTAAGPRRSTATSAPRRRSGRRGRPTRRAASGSGSPHGSTRSPCRRPTRSARCGRGLVREPVLGARDAARLDDPAAPVARGPAATSRRARSATRPALLEAAPTPARRARSRARPPGSVRRSRRGSAGEAWDARAMDRAIEEAERAGSPWLARLGRSLAHAACDRGRRTRDPSTRRRREDGGAGPVGRGAARPRRGVGRGRRPGAAPGARRTPQRASSGASGAGVLEAWARGLAALARREPRDARRPRGGAGRGVGGSRRRVAAGAHVSPTRRWPTCDESGAPSTALLAETRGGGDRARRAAGAGRRRLPRSVGRSGGGRRHGRRGGRPASGRGSNGARRRRHQRLRRAAGRPRAGRPDPHARRVRARRRRPPGPARRRQAARPEPAAAARRARRARRSIAR